MIANFWVLLVPEFRDQQQQKLRAIKAKQIRLSPPDPSTQGLWIRCSIDVPDAVFVHLVPHLQAKISSEAVEAMLAETSDLYARIVGIDQDVD